MFVITRVYPICVPILTQSLGINWELLHQIQPPAIQPFLPMTSEGKANIKGANRYSKSEYEMQMKLDMDTLSMNMGLDSVSDAEEMSLERREQLDKQAVSSPWHKLATNNKYNII